MNAWQSTFLSLAGGVTLLATLWPATPMEVQAIPTQTTCDSEACRIYRRFYEQRIVLVNQRITDDLASAVVASLVYLERQDATRPIYLYIDSSGGSVAAALTIYNAMQSLDVPVYTINVGVAESMAAFLLAAGEPGARLALSGTRVMIHQPQAFGSRATPNDIEAVVRVFSLLDGLMAQFTGQPIEKIQQDTQQDFVLSAEEAQRYGIIDQIIPADLLPEL